MAPVLAAVSIGDGGLTTTLDPGPYEPATGSGKGLAAGVLDKFIQAEATEGVPGPLPRPGPSLLKGRTNGH